MKLNQFSKGVGVGVFFLFTSLNAQSNNQQIIKDYLKKDASFSRLPSVEFQILNEDRSTSFNAEIINVQQYYEKTPIYKSLAKAVIRDEKVISFNNNFQKSQFKILDSKIDKDFAVNSALRHLNISKTDFQVLDETDGDLINVPDHKIVSSRYYFERNNNLIPAQLYFINQTDDKINYSILVSLLDGEILDVNNMLIECQFDHNHADHDIDNETNYSSLLGNSQLESAISTTNDVTNASYNVFPFPIEGPTFGDRAIVNNPWDLTASPLGWHSIPTTNYINTRGNNVFAYVDNNASNVTGFNPNSTTVGDLSFDFPFEESASLSAYDNKSAAVTNLFYANNKIHDVFYKFGFTESSRNYQTSNFDKGGIGGDAVRAEAYDGSGYNNANFNPGYERVLSSGTSQVQAPRMQMYLWNNGVSVKPRLYYNTEEYSSRPLVNSGLATNFGRQVMQVGVTGDIVIPTIADGCTALSTGSLTGKIALITHQGCDTDVKTKNAQTAGAKGVIIHRTNTNVASNMSSSGVTEINIPTIMIGKNEGDFITSEINNNKTINVTLKDLAVGYKNSSFDNGIVIHEYGHGISNRLTGQGYSCLNNVEQMGEGWSDFFALMLTNQPGDTEAKARGIGTYSQNKSTSSSGIRTYRYTPDMTINKHTYKNTNTSGGRVHYIGEIWATMLWDLHWKMVEKYGYSSDVTSDPNSGSAKTLQLVMDGLKLQPCNPNFVSGRDAILEADMLAGGADQCLIWSVFARRGLGVNASAGSANSITDQVENFDVPANCLLAAEEVGVNKNFGIYPNPAKGEFFIKTKPSVGNSSVKIEILDLNGKLVKSLERKKNDTDAISTKGLIKGTYLVVISENGKSTAEKLMVN